MSMPQVAPLPLIMFPSSLEMICCESSGRSKNVQRITPEEQSVVQHFMDNHSQTEDGHFIVPLPKKPHAKPLDESRCQAVRRFLSFE